MFRNNNTYAFVAALAIGLLLAAGVSVFATQIGSSISADSSLSAGGNLSVSGTSASSSITYALGIGTSTPAMMFSVGGAAGTATGHVYLTGGLGVGTATTTAGAFETTGAGLVAGVLNVGGLARFNSSASVASGLGVGVSTTTTGALQTSGPGLIAGAFNVGGATQLNSTASITGAATLSGTATFNSTATFGTNGTAVNSLIYGFCDFGPITSGQTIAASSTGVVACTTQAPTGLAAGDRVWLTASTTNATALQGGIGANVIVGLNYIYTGIASSTSSSRIQAVIYNLGNSSYTVTTSTWQYLIVK